MSEYAVNLAASLRAGALLGPDEAARAVLPLAEALAVEHEHGIVRGEVVPAYVAPEVSAGQEPTAATDVWSVGALLFHAMAGHAPYDRSPEAPARLRRAGWLGELVESALAEDPAARPSMAEVASGLRVRDRATATPEPTLHLPAPPPPPTRTHAAVRPPATPARRDRRTRILAVVLAVSVLVLAVIAATLIGSSNRRAAPVPGDAASTPASSAPTGTTTSPSATAPTAGTLESFARTYVMTASRNPTAGFRFLTDAYRRASPDYQRFWASVSNPRILSIHADPGRMTVTYTYRYTLPGAHGRTSRTETVTLDLVQQGGTFRISGAR